MKNNFKDIEIKELSHNKIKHVASLLTEWQKDSNFNRFLKEVPTNTQWNSNFLTKKMSWELVVAKVAKFSWEIVGIILLHSFDKKNKSLEGTLRISPDFQRKWFWTDLNKFVINDTLNNNEVDKIVSWHSAWNKWSFFVNKNCWWKIVDFVENQTFLPNIWKVTDDFKWEITKIIDWKNKDEDIKNIVIGEKDNIIFWLKKHWFIS